MCVWMPPGAQELNMAAPTFKPHLGRVSFWTFFSSFFNDRPHTPGAVVLGRRAYGWNRLASLHGFGVVQKW